MCCIGSDWMHLSTGVIGPDRRYVMAISSMQPTTADDGPRDHHPGRQDDVPRTGASSRPSRSGRRSARALQRLLAPPRRHLGVVPAQQHRRERRAPASSAAWCSSAPPAGRVLRGVRIILVRNGIAEHLGQQPDDRLDHDDGGRLPTGQHVVADRHLLDPHPARRVVDDALVDALVAPAREHQVRLGAPPLRVGLREQPARRASGRREVFRASRFRRGPHPTRAPSSPFPGRRRTANRPPSGARRGSSARRSCTPRSTMPASIALPGNDCRSGSR